MSAFKSIKRYLPSTGQLFELRQKIVKSELQVADTDEEKLFAELLALRKKVSLIITEKGTPLSNAEQCFLDAWVLFSQFSLEHDFYLPPLYKSEQLNKTLKVGIEGLLQREGGFINGCDNNVGHLVLGGVEGAGKTTLMRALALGAAALLQKMIPICHDYLEFKEPEELVWEAILAYGYNSSEFNDQWDPLEILNAFHKQAFLLLDEFQHNFRFVENPDWEGGKRATLTFHRYSRTNGTYGVIGGSSVDMHLLMFKSGSGETTDFWRKRGYADFNGTLYELRTVPALRTTGELKDYIGVRYPAWDLSDADISLLLAYTGGIGRWVHKVWETSRYDALQSTTENDPPETAWISLCFEERLRECTSYRKVQHVKFLEVPANRELVAFLLTAAQPVKDSYGNVVSCGGVERNTLLLSLEMAGISSPSDVINNAQALSVIYIDLQSRIQFSHPVDWNTYREGMPPETHRLLLLSAVHLMVCGITHENGDVTDVNGGNALEELVRQGVYEAARINDEVQFEPDIILTIQDKKLCRKTIATDAPSPEPFSIDLLKSLNLKHISWQKEHGLDGICFEENSEDESWYLDVWQCKGGRWDLEIGGGNNSFKTALTNYKKHYHLKDIGDKQITEIVLKAQVGICIIVDALRTAIPNVIVKPRKLVVTTTKQCGLSCAHTVNTWKKAGGVVIERDILAHFGFNSQPKIYKALKSKFEVEVESGYNWVVAAIPELALREAANHLFGPSVVPSTSTRNAVAPPASYRNHRKAGCVIQ